MTIIRQKLTPIPKGEGPVEKALRTALTRAARERASVDLAVTTLDARTDTPVLADLVPNHGLIFALADESRPLGAAIMGPTLFSALVEAQMTGRVLPAGPSRPPTQIDATLCRDMVELSLAILDTALTDVSDWMTGLRISHTVPSADVLTHVLPDGPMRRLSATMLIAGTRTGVLTLLLPWKQPALLTQNTETEFQDALAQQVMGAETTLNAVLCHFTSRLSTVMSLKVGDVLTLPHASIDRVDIATACGKAVGHGRLGQSRGMRALRLSEENVQTPQPGALVEKP